MQRRSTRGIVHCQALFAQIEDRVSNRLLAKHELISTPEFTESVWFVPTSIGFRHHGFARIGCAILASVSSGFSSRATIMVTIDQPDIDAFVDLPWRLHQGDPAWIPPMRTRVREELATVDAFRANGGLRRFG